MKKLLFCYLRSLAWIDDGRERCVVVFGNLVITQISPENPTTFDDDRTRTNAGHREFDGVRYRLLPADQFSTDGGVANGTTSASPPRR